MTKLLQDAKAFAAMVKMSRFGVYVLVEGRTGDRTFYGRILEHHATAKSLGYVVRLVEDIKLDETSAGGKTAILKMFNFFESNEMLVQHNSHGSRRIGFMLDRDYDHLAEVGRSNPHLIYTKNSDVEAEILLNGDLIRATATTYWIGDSDVGRIIPDQEELLSELAIKYRDWITLLVLAVKYNVATHVHHARVSKVNVDEFGPVDPASVSRALNAIKACLDTDSAEEQVASVYQDVNAIFESGQERSLLKGEWIASFIKYLIDHQQHFRVRTNTQRDSLLSTCCETLEFTEPWIEHFHDRLTNLLSY